MVWCSYCAKDQQAERDDINGFTCCTGCGRVLDDNVYGSDPTFTKTAGGQSQVEGNFVKDGQSSFGRLGAGAGRILGYQSDSHEKTLAKGKHEILEILERLSIRPRDDIATQAHRFYTIALERNFTRGRRTQQVAASCIYIVCRQNNKPYMLIDFSDCLQTNVYVLGAVFLQLCNLLRLEEQPFMQKPVDPSLFIHRFADRLRFGKKMHAVSNTALRLVASMKRNWMQTGRRPSGICGAALFISAHMHGFERSKSDVVSVVHICEGTLKRRLVEFECTESGSLTAEEFELKGQEMEAQIKAAVHFASNKGSTAITEISCEHKDTGTAHFSHGLCQPCYEEFVRVSGGMQGGSAPPAFQRAELQRMQAVRDQLKSQGLNSDDEDEEGAPMQSLKERKEGTLLSGKAEDLVHVEVGQTADLPPTGRGRGRGRGSGRGRGRLEMKGQVFNEEAEIDDSEPLLRIGRRLRGRGIKKDEQSINADELAQTTKAGPGAPVINSVIKHKLGEGDVRKSDVHSHRVTDDSIKLHEDLFGEPPELVDSDVATTKDLSPPILDPLAGKTGSNDNGEVELNIHRTDSILHEDSLSDIDDNELIGYMNNDEEVRLKTIIWTEMNKDYIQEQEAKQAALAAMEQARAAAVAAAASNSTSAAELAAAAAAAVAQMKKDRRQKRVDDAKRPPAQSAAEATRQMLESKKLSTKVDYTVLAKLFDTDESQSHGTTGKLREDEDGDSEPLNTSSKRTRLGSQTDGSQGESVITQISARKSLTREVDSKEGSVGAEGMTEDEVVVDEDDGMAEFGEVDVEELSYDYDEPDEYYDEY